MIRHMCHAKCLSLLMCLLEHCAYTKTRQRSDSMELVIIVKDSGLYSSICRAMQSVGYRVMRFPDSSEEANGTNGAKLCLPPVKKDGLWGKRKQRYVTRIVDGMPFRHILITRNRFVTGCWRGELSPFSL